MESLVYHRRVIAAATLLGTTLALGPAPDAKNEPVTDEASESAESASETSAPKETPAPPRKFLVGIQAVGIQVPPIRPYRIELDRRFVGNTATMAGLGIMGRYRPVERVSVELGIRSGSARYELSDDRVLSHDMVLADMGLVLWVAHGKGGRVGLDMGVGGAFNALRYNLGPRSSQIFGFGHVRGGATAELSFRRFAFLFAVRAFGTFTGGNSANRGPLFDGAGAEAEAPIPKLQLIVAGSLGVGYRF
jgi:hypothetical protein